MPIIFIPGIKGSELVDTYPINFPVRWSLEDMVPFNFFNLFEDEEDFLLRDGLYDKDFHLFREWKPIDYAYGRLLKKLRENDSHCYVYPYDWRRTLERSAEQLTEFIRHISGKHTQKTTPEISFVTHSMGGLVLRSALGLIHSRDLPIKIGRIVFIAPPFRGAIGAIKSLIVGERDGWLGDRDGYRKLARSFPSIYQLIPSFKNALIDSVTKESLDPFDIDNWQANVTQGGKGFQNSFLKNAKAFVGHEQIQSNQSPTNISSEAPMLQEETFVQSYGDRTLILLGTNHKTPWQIPVIVDNPRNRNWFDFDNVEENSWGDGRVHLKSVAIEGVTLAAFDTQMSHGRVCREETIYNATKMWLDKGRVLKMKPRTKYNSVNRPGRTYFSKWNGNESSFKSHRVNR